MNSYRINFSEGNDKMSFYTRAENCRQAVGKFILNMKDLMFDSDVISACREVLAGSVYDAETEFLVYESEELSFDCSRITMIVPDKLDEENPFDQSFEYVYKNLPPHLAKALEDMDVAHIICFRDEFVDKNGFYLDAEGEPTDEHDQDATLYFHPDEAAKYILDTMDSLTDEHDLTLPRIKEVLAIASEYEQALRQAFKKPTDDPIHSIDISGISVN
jgi:hypothetical protein